MTDDPLAQRVVVRVASDGSADDVVVRDVSMFRAEMMDADRLWLCCYLPTPGGDDQRITFEVAVRNGVLDFQVVERPTVAG